MVSHHGGNQALTPSTILAPMEGVTDAPMRSILAQRGGLAMVCTEFCRVHASRYSKRQIRKAVIKVEGTPLSVQIMGRDIETMCYAAAALAEQGADIIDINLGCPSRNATKSGVGASLLTDIPHLKKLLRALRAVVKVPFTAKMRAGFDEAHGALYIAKTIEDEGVDFITVHPRTRAELYTGHANWDIIADIKAQLSIPIIGNGDILCAQDALDMYTQTSCDGIMIGRGALRNPWIFKQLEQLQNNESVFIPKGIDVYQAITDLHQAFVDAGFPLRIQYSRLKANIAMMGQNIGDGKTLRREILLAQTLDEVLLRCKKYIPAVDDADIHMGVVEVFTQS